MLITRLGRAMARGRPAAALAVGMAVVGGHAAAAER